jgi:hypothetical protein
MAQSCIGVEILHRLAFRDLYEETVELRSKDSRGRLSPHEHIQPAPTDKHSTRLPASAQGMRLRIEYNLTQIHRVRRSKQQIQIL